MKSHVRRGAAVPVVLMLGAALLLTGCSESTEEKEAAACESYQAYAEAVARLDTLDQASSVDEIADVRDDVKAAHETLVEDLEAVADDRDDQLVAAWEAFGKAVDDIDGDATVPEAAASLSEEVAAIRAAREQVAADLTC
ncbi:MAG: hypothetical protein ACI379_06770 [Nocardioides sp.]|uniref:hypothetical protein n=1 Tax=Nocardioides sp. TaxID=35761 RepID=UPI003F045140